MRDPCEEQAWKEVGHTMVAPWLARVVVGWFVLTLAALPAVEWVGGGLAAPSDAAAASAWARLASLPASLRTIMASPEAAGPSIFWDRLVPANRAALTAFAAFETDLEDQSSVGRTLRPPAQALLSEWLGAGNERVYIGRDGWLFYRPDVEHVTGDGVLDPAFLERRRRTRTELRPSPHPDPRPAVRQFARDLAERGITLVVVPTPVKPSMHPERLSPRRFPGDAPVHNQSYAALVEAWRRDGVLVFDAASAMLAAGVGEAPLYLRTDTHWRPEAMQAVAAALANFIATRVDLPTTPLPGYRSEPREARHEGDTAAMLDLPRGVVPLYTETVPLLMVLGEDGDPWRPTRGADVLVLGDSFSNIYSLPTMGWGEAAGLVEHLSLALRRPVDRIVQNDDGASATRLALARDPARLATTRVVVWQFAARELSYGNWVPVPIGPR